MEKVEIEAKVIRQGGQGFIVQCPSCLTVHAGNALDGFLRSKTPMSCGDNGIGCKAVLRLSE